MTKVEYQGTTNATLPLTDVISLRYQRGTCIPVAPPPALESSAGQCQSEVCSHWPCTRHVALWSVIEKSI